MSRRVGRAAGAARRWLLRRLRHGQDSGFILLESLIAITVITIVMSAVGAEFLGGMISASQQRAQQGAVQLADTTMEQIRSLNPSDLVTGRDSTSVTTQFTAATPKVGLWLAKMDKAIDPASGLTSASGPAAAVPTVAVTPPAMPIAYSVNQYLGWCYKPSLSTSCDTLAVSGAGSTKFLRAVVAVTWTGQGCARPDAANPTAVPCSYVTSTLISTGADPTFRINSGAYAAPVVTAMSARTNVLGDTGISVQMTVQSGTGVPLFTWAVTGGSLPNGVTLSAAGLVSGTVQGPAGAYSATIQVTDAFLRTDAKVLSWTVKPALTLTDPGPQATVVNSPASLALAATGGDGGPFTYTILNNTLPPGMTLTSGVISGSPTTVGSYNVQVRVVDVSGTRSATSSFTWTVADPPFAASTPLDQVNTINTTISPLQLAAAGGSGPYSWSDPSNSLPSGLVIAPAGLISGSATALADPGKSVVLTVRDTAGHSATVAFIWKILPRPSVAAPYISATYTLGQSVTWNLAPSCPNSACSYAVNGGPSGLSVTSAGVLSGTVGGVATTYSAVTIAVTDKDGATGTSSAFTINVVDRPTVAGLAQTSTVGSVVSYPLTTTCLNTTCTYVLSGGPSGLSVDNTGVIKGTVGGTPQQYSNVTVTVTDAGGISATSGAFTWNVQAAGTLSLSGLAATSIGVTTTPSNPLSYSCPTATCTITLAGALSTTPVGIGLSSTSVVTTANATKTLQVTAGSGTVYLTGLVSSTAFADSTTTQAYGLTLTISNTSSSAVSNASYTVYRKPTISTPGSISTARGVKVVRTLTYACLGTCTVTVSGLPGGVGLDTNTSAASNNVRTLTVNKNDDTIYLTGKFDSTIAPSDYLVTVSITDGTTTVTSSGIWTVS